MSVGVQWGPKWGAPRGPYWLDGNPWTSDGTSAIAIPQSATEWSSFIAGKGLSVSSPASLYRCQESAGPTIADSIGAFPLSVAGSGDSYQNVVTGWASKAIKLTDGVSGSFRSLSTSLPDISTTSCAILAFVVFPGSIPAATRALFQLGSTTIATARMNVTTGFLSAVSGANVANGATNETSAVIPVFLKVDRTGAAQVCYTATEKLVPAFSTSLTGKQFYLGNSGTAGSFGYLYACRWDGAAAEISDANVKALLQAMGWTVTWV